MENVQLYIALLKLKVWKIYPKSVNFACYLWTCDPICFGWRLSHLSLSRNNKGYYGLLWCHCPETTRVIMDYYDVTAVFFSIWQCFSRAIIRYVPRRQYRTVRMVLMFDISNLIHLRLFSQWCPLMNYKQPNIWISTPAQLRPVAI